MRMAVAEGVRNMFYEFATCKAFEISKVRQDILVEHAFSEDSSDEIDDHYLRNNYPDFIDEDDETDEEDDSEGDM